MLKSHLEGREESEAVVLVFTKEQEAANCLKNELNEDGIYAQSLHPKEDSDRELAVSSLKSRTYLPTCRPWNHRARSPCGRPESNRQESS